VIEKLLENWLDNASERSYQSVFVQMLHAQGYKVVHSTRHNALEFGKDILAIAPDGVGCAYQLKGNPGGRLGLNQFRSEIQPQLVQLMTQSVAYPGFPEGIHRSYLVTNGYFEEEVQVAIQQLNANQAYPSKVELISRGELLRWSFDFGVKLWPTELRDTRTLLEIFLSDSNEVLPKKQLFQILTVVQKLDDPTERLSGRPALERALTSSALLTGVVTAHFVEAENYFAVTISWVLFCVSLIATVEKHSFKIDGFILETLKLAEYSAYESLALLWREVKSKKYLVEGNTFTDPEVYGWRVITLIGLFSSLAIANEQLSLLDEDECKALHQWLKNPPTPIDVWGEAAVASLLPWVIWIRKKDSTLRPDDEIYVLTELIIKNNQSKSTTPLANPYYDFSDVAKHRYHLFKVGEERPFERETFSGNAFTAQTLMYLLVRTKNKSRCKQLWANFTKISHRSLEFDEAWHYCLMKTQDGVENTYIYPSPYSWDKLKSDTFEVIPKIPTPLAERPALLSLWWQAAPHRVNVGSAYILVEALIPNWGN
jgi:hypothetical protein